MTKTKILFIIGGLGVGGKERQLVEIINNLPKDKYEIQLIIKEINGYYYDLINLEKCTIHNVNWKGYKLLDHFQSIKYIKKIIQVVNEFKPNYVVSFSKEFSIIYYISSVFFKYHPVIINCVIRDSPITKSIRLSLFSLFLSRLKYVVSNSNAGMQTYNQTGIPNRYVLYNGFNQNRINCSDKNLVRDELSLPQNKFIVISVANLTEKKDYKTFLKTISNIDINILSNMLFILVGDGTKRDEVEKLIDEYLIRDYILMMGFRSDVEFLLRASDLSILCSFSEGISNSVIESMFSGLSVLATGEGGLNETILNGFNGYLYSIGDYISLANKIEELYHDREQINKLGNNAFKYANEVFSIDKMINNFENILNIANEN